MQILNLFSAKQFLFMSMLIGSPAIPSSNIYSNNLATTSYNAKRLVIDATNRHLQSYDDNLFNNQFGGDNEILGYDDDFMDSMMAIAIDDTIGTFTDTYENTVGDLDFIKCVEDTDALILSNPKLEQAYQNFINSELSDEGFDPDTMTVNINIYYPEHTKELLRQACTESVGFFDVNVGSLTCEYLMTVTTVTGFVGCLADTEECREKGNYDHLEFALESQSFNKCSAPPHPLDP